MSTVRICAHRDCRTLLSRFNPGDRCWNHTPDLVEQMTSGRHVELARDRAGVMSARFLRGVDGERLSSNDRRALRTGRWLGSAEEAS